MLIYANETLYLVLRRSPTEHARSSQQRALSSSVGEGGRPAHIAAVPFTTTSFGSRDGLQHTAADCLSNTLVNQKTGRTNRTFHTLSAPRTTCEASESYRYFCIFILDALLPHSGVGT